MDTGRSRLVAGTVQNAPFPPLRERLAGARGRSIVRWAALDNAESRLANREWHVVGDDRLCKTEGRRRFLGRDYLDGPQLDDSYRQA